MKIEKNILQIIESGKTEGALYFLPGGQLDRGIYLQVNKVLELLGGKWNRKERAHVFEESIESAIESVILTGEITDQKKEFQFFETSQKIADQLCDMAELETAKSILEPSAGRGAILKTIRQRTEAEIYYSELELKNRTALREQGVGHFIGANFLECVPFDVDRVIMNPPFSKQQDIDHVTHALKFIEKGILVSIMSPAIQFRTNRKTTDFLKLINEYENEITELPEGSFKESGTSIRTIILKVEK